MAFNSRWWFTGGEDGIGYYDIYDYTGNLSATSTGLRTGALGNYALAVGTAQTTVRWDTSIFPSGGQNAHIRLWAKMDTTFSDAFRVFSEITSTGNTIGLHFNANDDSIDLYDNSGLNTSSSTSVWPSDGTWFEIYAILPYAATASGTAKVYIDGTEVISVTDFNLGANNMRWLGLQVQAGAGTLYADDIIKGIGSTSSDTSYVSADIHVVQYRSTLASSTGDFGGCTLTSGNWSDNQNIPFGGGNTFMASTTGSATSNDYSGVITNDAGGADGSGGPSGDSYVSNTYSLLSHRYMFRGNRTNGSSPTSYGLNAGSYDSSYANVEAIDGGTLTTSLGQYFVDAASDSTNVPTSSTFGALGYYHTDDGGRDIQMADFMYMTTLEVVSTGNTLSANAGSYTLTGAAADFDVGMDANSGSYSYTGSAANFNLGVTLAAEAGSYTYTGSAAEFANGWAIPAEAGSYTLTGSAADFDVSMEAEAGSYTYTGSAADFALSKSLMAEAGSYAVTGSAVDFYNGYAIAAEAGSYAYTGSAVEFPSDVTLSADAGSYTLTGSDADLLGQFYLGTSVTGTETAYFADWTEDPTKGWLNDQNAADGNTNTYAYTTSEGNWDADYAVSSNPLPAAPWLKTLWLDQAIPPANGEATHISKVRYRAKIQVTGTGTPQMQVSVIDRMSFGIGGNRYVTLQQDLFTQATANFTAWTEITPPPGGWPDYLSGWPGDGGGLIRLIFAGKDDTGTLTEARLYYAELEFTYSDASYRLALDLPNVIQSYPDAAAEAGSYTLTGSDADFSVGLTMPAESGSYSVTGSAATLKPDWNIDAESGSYTYTGFQTNLQGGSDLAAEGGAYTYTGSDATLAAAKTLSAEAGSYAATGSDADLFKTFSLAAESGSYAATGSAAGLKLDIVFPANAGSYTCTGSDAALNATIGAMSAEAGAYTYTGSDATIERTFQPLSAEAGAYTLTGADPYIFTTGVTTRRVIMIG